MRIPGLFFPFNKKLTRLKGSPGTEIFDPRRPAISVGILDRPFLRGASFQPWKEKVPSPNKPEYQPWYEFIERHVKRAIFYFNSLYHFLRG